MTTKKWTQGWHQQQVAAYDKERPAYILYARLLNLMMSEACRRHADEGHASARAKELASFAEKAIRKYDKYPDPIHQFTDLCGARAVLLTQSEADRVANFVKKNFLIDQDNSEDVRTRLKPDQFGYRAIHYVVQMPWLGLVGHGEFKEILNRLSRQFETDLGPFLKQVGDPNANELLNNVLREGASESAAKLFEQLKQSPGLMAAEGIEILRRAVQQIIDEDKHVTDGYRDPLQIICAIGNRKAEIQVQTLLQHGWAAISHDRLYKTNFQAPRELERQLTRVAALLEESDEQFSRSIAALEEYQLDYGKYLTPQEIEAEISKWKAVAECESKNLKVALTIAEYAKAIEQWDEIIARLSGFAGTQDCRVLRLLGLAKSKKDHNGRQFLEAAVRCGHDDPAGLCLLAETFCQRSDCLEHNGGGSTRSGCQKALSLFGKAFGDLNRCEPGGERALIKDPHAFRRYAECLMCSGHSRDLCALAAPALQTAWDIAYRRSDVHVRALESLYDMGFFALLLGRPYHSLGAYARGVFLSPTESAIEAELRALERLGKATKGSNPPDWTEFLPWIIRFLQLARIAKLQQMARQAPDKVAQKTRELTAQQEELENRKKDWSARKAELNDLQPVGGLGVGTGRKVDVSRDTPAFFEGLIRDRNVQEARLRAEVAASAVEEGLRAVVSARKALKEAKEQATLTRIKAENALAEFKKLRLHNVSVKGKPLPFGRNQSPVVVLVGGCDPSSEPQMRSYAKLLVEGFDGFSGIICSGGTRAGIAGIAGDVQEHYGKAVITIGYLPDLGARKVAKWIIADKRYQHLVPTSGDDFSALEPLQYWTDIIASGISPYEVRILGINGGLIAALEYRLALAFDASVAVLEKSGREAAKLLQNEDWGVAERLIVLPAEVPVIRAYVRAGTIKASPGLTVNEATARQIHANYLRLRAKQATQADPSLKPWEKLHPDLQAGNFEQAKHWGDHLNQIGYAVCRKKKLPVPVANLGPEEIEELAEMEHARYLVERFLKGWKYGEKKDIERKTNPTLLGWAKLPASEKEKDRDAARGALKLFASNGYLICKQQAARPVWVRAGLKQGLPHLAAVY